MNKRILGVTAAVAMGAVLPVASVSAWGPERPTYTNNSPADHAVFNSITDNAAVGDERDFVRIAEKVPGAQFGDEVKLEAGKQYEVYIYYHNDASATYNDAAHNYVGVARNTRVASYFPHELAAGEQGTISGVITWDQAGIENGSVPAAEGDDVTEEVIGKVWDEAYVTTDEALTLHYVDGSAKIYNGNPTNGSVLPYTLFSAEGTFIGVQGLDGVILGCDEYSGQIVYTLQTEAVEEVAGTEVPKELPKTGPMEIVLAVMLVLVVMAGVMYWSKTRHAVSKATRKAKGRK